MIPSQRFFFFFFFFIISERINVKAIFQNKLGKKIIDYKVCI